MSEIIIKKDKAKINDGGHNAFGVDIDPKKNLKHIKQLRMILISYLMT